MSIRRAACVLTAAALCACSSGKGGHAAASPPPAAVATGPANAPVPAPGATGAIALDDAQRAELDRTVAGAPPAARARLRYALAVGDDGKRRLVVYDGQGLPADGRRAGKSNVYTVFRVLNGSGSEHYDPQANALIAPIPPPPQRDGNGVTQ